MMADRTPALAVIIACYNYEHFIADAIESVLSQANEKCELIVVDDGSTDRSWDIISSYKLAKAFHISNRGQSPACYYGARESTASHVLFLDADDKLAPGALATIIEELDENVAKLQFSLTPIDEHGDILGPPIPRIKDFRSRDQLIQEIIEEGCYVTPPTSGNVFSRALCELFPEVDYEQAADGVALIAAPFYGDVVSLAKPLGFYRLHAANMSQFGNIPTEASFAKELDRFAARLNHLKIIIAKREYGVVLPDPTTLFFYRERAFFQAIVGRRRPSVGSLGRLVWSILPTRRPGRHKISMLLFIFLIFLLPVDRAERALVYRFKPEHRSITGLFKSIFGVSQAPEALCLDE